MSAAAAPREKEVLARHLRDAYMEVFPAAGVARKLAVLERGAFVAVTCSPAKGPGETLALSAELVGAGFRVIPHIAARNVRDARELAGIVRRLKELGIESLFVPGGDRPEPAGEFRTALDLLRALAELDHGLNYIGVAAHPEGHPAVAPETLLDELARKQDYANYMVTQLCFDAPALGRWLKEVRARGITLPAWIGLPGVLDRARLVKTSLRIGVGDSLRFLRRNPRAVGAIMRSATYRPDGLLAALAPVAAEPQAAVDGYHLFCFNEVAETEAWRTHAARALE